MDKDRKNSLNELSSNLYPELHQQESDILLSELKEKVRVLEKQNLEMRVALEEAGISSDQVRISETEYICLQQLRILKEQSEQRPLDRDEVTMLDVLHKNLLIAKGITPPKKSKEKKKTVDELLKIVNSPK